MVKEVFFFTEMGYSAYSQETAARYGYTNLMFPNENYDPQKATELYSMYFDELQYCTESGFDGVMINEHHNNPLSLMPSVNVIGAVLAKLTQKGKIVFLGNVLPIHENPVRVAEEVAMIDVISGGRVVCGFVRGIGQESMATNTNPVFNRERFEEAHDLVIKTWTTPGPFRWEGKHYHFRIINPFEVPLQKPHPPVWIPGTGSPETLVWCAERHYPYIYLETDAEATRDMITIYAETARLRGYEPGPQHFGYLLRIHVQDTDEKAREVARGYLVGNVGVGRIPLPADYMSPPGYNSRDARFRKLSERIRRDPLRGGGVDTATYEAILQANRITAGNPDTVIKKLRAVLSALRPGTLGVWTNDGAISLEDTMRCLTLMGKEVLPALRDIAKELEITDPFQT